MLGDTLHPSLVPKWLATLDGAPQRLLLRFRLWPVDARQPIGRACDRPSGERLWPFARNAPSPPRPRPLLRALHQVRAERISLHIAQHREQVVVVLDGMQLLSAFCARNAADES